ncbi:putative ABC transporter permease protein [Gordonia araii NBRC 100433]|uniref:Transport permease protein n=1 Tax=Gordonia araii NBRC 100433 TaxID=1073574 RepID=G7GXV5_9ACTN|nr:ABC transporter permease [Gordonia araii]NNG98374.1 ABC transporter permease [Gordonia araii NBRC 100433]GAB08430.1 putative ABC transporter permease protein [Gordonia araii NBRC 100433]
MTQPTSIGRVAAGPPAAPAPRGWMSQTWILTGRQVMVWLRDPFTLISALVSPLLALILFKVVLGDVIGSATGQDSAFGTVPMVILISAMFGSIAAAVRLNTERSTGLLARLATLPINRTADLSSRVAAELVRIVITTGILLVAGYAIGFRFTQGFLPVLGIFGVALLFGGMFAVLVLALAVTFPPGGPIVPLLSLLCSVLMFFNSGFAPADGYPGWLQPLVRYQPMTPAIEVMRNLAAGGPVAGNLLIVVAWAIALVAVFAYPALRGYAKAATSRN